MSEVNKAQVKKAKAKVLKVSKKFQLNHAANVALDAVDTLVQAGEFAKALEAVTAANAAIILCPAKQAKPKPKEHDDFDDLDGGGAAKELLKLVPTNVPEVEQPVAVESIDAISAEGVALGLGGAELVKFALRRLGAGTAVVQAEVAMAGRTSDVATHYRTNNCVELRTSDIGKSVALVGWVAKTRFVGQMLGFVDLRDRYGVTQCVFENVEGNVTANALFKDAECLGREFCVCVVGTCRERSAKNPRIPTGFIEVLVSELRVLTQSKTPPFLIADDAGCSEDMRLTYRYLDIRRNPIKNSLILRNQVMQMTRNYLNKLKFCEVETPVLIKSTPEGARDFVVPSRLNPGQWYALPQSPQTFKQILMVAGMDRYFQIAKCFRDEDLRPDRQLEFTQIDCEMSFVEQEDILITFEGLIRLLFRELRGVEFPGEKLQRMEYADAMTNYGIDKPDLRFGMQLHDITDLTKGRGCSLFDESELVLGIAVEGSAERSKKDIADWTKTAQGYGVAGMATIKVTLELASSVKKFFTTEELQAICNECHANEGDLVCIFWGRKNDKFREMVGKFRHFVGDVLGMRSTGFHALWVVNFPLVEWNEEQGRHTAKHHPFTSCKTEDQHLMASDATLGQVRANAYDLVVNGVEVGGGSIRIHNKDLQHEIFKILGFTREEAQQQFGFLLGAFEFGAPPHGGLAFGELFARRGVERDVFECVR